GQIGVQFVLNFLSHFSPDFLLLSGDKELRHSAGVGMLNAAEVLAAIAGVVFAVRGRCRWAWLLICWVVLSPVAASLTRVGVPHALRCQLTLPAWQLLAAYGLMRGAAACTDAKKFWQIATLVTLCGFLPFVFSYFGDYKYRS